MACQLQPETVAEELLVDAVLSASRRLQGAGGFEVRMRPGWTPRVIRVAHQELTKAVPLRDADSRQVRQATRTG